MAENRAVVIREQGWCGADCNGVGRIFWCDGMVIYLDFGDDYITIVCQNSQKSILKIMTLLYVTVYF